MTRKSTEQNAGVSADAGFWIGLGLREVPEKVVVEYPVSELVIVRSLCAQISKGPSRLTFGAMRSIDLTVASRITGTMSPKPVSCDTVDVSTRHRHFRKNINELDGAKFAPQHPCW